MSQWSNQRFFQNKRLASNIQRRNADLQFHFVSFFYGVLHANKQRFGEMLISSFILFHFSMACFTPKAKIRNYKLAKKNLEETRA